MKINYLPKIEIRLPRKFVDKTKNLNFSNIYKPAFIIGYLIACFTVLVPQIDHQSWYPKFLGTFDYTKSVEFSNHKKVIINSNNENQSTLESIIILNDRFNEIRIIDRSMDFNDELTIRVPEDISDNILSFILSHGSLTLKQRTEDITNYEELYNPKNYSDVDINMDAIKDAEVINQENGYTTIELTFTDEQSQKDWNNLAQQVESSSLGLFVDGELYISQISPSTDGQPKTRLIVYSEDQETRLIASFLRNPDLKSVESVEILDSPPIYSLDIKIILPVVVLLSILAGLVFRYYFRPKSLKTTINLILITVGVLTVTKVLPISWNMTSILLLGFMLAIILITELKKIPILLLTTSTLGIIAEQIGRYSFGHSPKIIYVASIYSLVIYLISFFLGEYENI